MISIQRKKDFDFCKGVLIFIVVWGHVCPTSSDSEYTTTWCALARITSLFAMPLFFLLSGYFSKSIKSFKEIYNTIKKSFCRLGIPLLAWGVIVVFLKIQVFETNFVVSKNIFLTIKSFLGFILGFYWYISALLLCIILGSLLSYLCCRVSPQARIMINICSIIMIPCIPFSLFHFTFVWPFYLLGNLIANNRNIDNIFVQFLKAPFIYILLPYIICIYFGFSFYPYKTFYFSSYNPIEGGYIVILRFLLYLTTTLLTFIILRKIYNQSNKLLKFISEVGKETLFIYMCHMVILFYVYKPLIQWLTDSAGLLPNYPIIRYYVYSPIISIILFYTLFKLSIHIKKYRILNTLFNGNYK